MVERKTDENDKVHEKVYTDGQFVGLQYLLPYFKKQSQTTITVKEGCTYGSVNVKKLLDIIRIDDSKQLKLWRVVCARLLFLRDNMTTFFELFSIDDLNNLVLCCDFSKIHKDDQVVFDYGAILL